MRLLGTGREPGELETRAVIAANPTPGYTPTRSTAECQDTELRLSPEEDCDHAPPICDAALGEAQSPGVRGPPGRPLQAPTPPHRLVILSEQISATEESLLFTNSSHP